MVARPFASHTPASYALDRSVAIECQPVLRELLTLDLIVANPYRRMLQPTLILVHWHDLVEQTFDHTLCHVLLSQFIALRHQQFTLLASRFSPLLFKF